MTVRPSGPFSRSADHYDTFYADKDYAAEAALITHLAVEHSQHPPTSLLDVACGTGRHLEHWTDKLRCEGTDIDPSMIRIARRRLPHVDFACADMTELDLGRRFSIVCCLFSSIGYVQTLERLRAAVRAMAAHLEPAGVLFIQPWVLPAEWDEPGGVTVNDIDDGDRRLVRVIASLRHGHLSTLRIHYVIAEPAGIETADETHTLGLFTKTEYLDACQAAGLNATWRDDTLFVRGLIVATQPTS